MQDPGPPSEGRPSRRSFLKGASLGVAATTVLGAAREGVQEAASQSSKSKVLEAQATHEISLKLNGKATTAKVRTGHTLLETLRDQLDLTGTKLVCDHGSCGACTVILNGRPMNSCLTLAVDADGAEIQTVEGLATEQGLHPIQAAFVAEDALQCGFCTSGMIMSCKALLDRNPRPSLDETKDALCGNICRCGTYVNIFRAVDRASLTLGGNK